MRARLRRARPREPGRGGPTQRGAPNGAWSCRRSQHLAVRPTRNDQARKLSSDVILGSSQLGASLGPAPCGIAAASGREAASIIDTSAVVVRRGMTRPVVRRAAFAGRR